MIIYCRHYFN